MALTPNTNEAFRREVDSELRREQALRFGQRFGVWIVVAIVAGLIALAGWLYWQHRQREAAAAEGVALQDAFDQLGAGKFDAVKGPLARLATSKVDGYRVAARFTQADILLKNEDLTGAAKVFAGIAADPSVAAPFRDLALIRQTTAEFDTLAPAVVVQRLKAIAAKGNPWFGSAGELVAAAYLRQGRRDLAGRLFAQISEDEDVPATLRQRAVQMAGLLGIDAVGGDVKTGDVKAGDVKTDGNGTAK